MNSFESIKQIQASNEGETDQREDTKKSNLSTGLKLLEHGLNQDKDSNLLLIGPFVGLLVSGILEYLNHADPNSYWSMFVFGVSAVWFQIYVSHRMNRKLILNLFLDPEMGVLPLLTQIASEKNPVALNISEIKSIVSKMTEKSRNVPPILLGLAANISENLIDSFTEIRGEHKVYSALTDELDVLRKAKSPTKVQAYCGTKNYASNSVQSYFKANLAAALEGVSIERIFPSDSSALDSAREQAANGVKVKTVPNMNKMDLFEATGFNSDFGFAIFTKYTKAPSRVLIVHEGVGSNARAFRISSDENPVIIDWFERNYTSASNVYAVELK